MSPFDVPSPALMSALRAVVAGAEAFLTSRDDLLSAAGSASAGRVVLAHSVCVAHFAREVCNDVADLRRNHERQAVCEVLLAKHAALRTLCTRPEFLGRDRRGTSYYIFSGDCSRVFCERVPVISGGVTGQSTLAQAGDGVAGDWSVIQTMDVLNNFMHSLNPAGASESGLLRALQRNKPAIALAISNRSALSNSPAAAPPASGAAAPAAAGQAAGQPPAPPTDEAPVEPLSATGRRQRKKKEVLLPAAPMVEQAVEDPGSGAFAFAPMEGLDAPTDMVIFQPQKVVEAPLSRPRAVKADAAAELDSLTGGVTRSSVMAAARSACAAMLSGIPLGMFWGSREQAAAYRDMLLRKAAAATSGAHIMHVCFLLEHLIDMTTVDPMWDCHPATGVSSHWVPFAAAAARVYGLDKALQFRGPTYYLPPPPPDQWWPLFRSGRAIPDDIEFALMSPQRLPADPATAVGPLAALSDEDVANLTAWAASDAGVGITFPPPAQLSAVAAAVGVAPAVVIEWLRLERQSPWLARPCSPRAIPAGFVPLCQLGDGFGGGTLGGFSKYGSTDAYLTAAATGGEVNREPAAGQLTKECGLCAAHVKIAARFCWRCKHEFTVRQTRLRGLAAVDLALAAVGGDIAGLAGGVALAAPKKAGAKKKPTPASNMALVPNPIATFEGDGPARDRARRLYGGPTWSTKPPLLRRSRCGREEREAAEAALAAEATAAAAAYKWQAQVAEYVAMRPAPVSSRMQRLEAVLLKVCRYRNAVAFCSPVDHGLVPTYYNVVKEPMDLHVVLAKLRAGLYGDDPQRAAEDVKLVWENCRLFNEPSAPIVADTITLQRNFDTLFRDWVIAPQTASKSGPWDAELAAAGVGLPLIIDEPAAAPSHSPATASGSSSSSSSSSSAAAAAARPASGGHAKGGAHAPAESPLSQSAQPLAAATTSGSGGSRGKRGAAAAPEAAESAAAAAPPSTAKKARRA
jgi:hypothetical protein